MSFWNLCQHSHRIKITSSCPLCSVTSYRAKGINSRHAKHTSLQSLPGKLSTPALMHKSKRAASALRLFLRTYSLLSAFLTQWSEKPTTKPLSFTLSRAGAPRLEKNTVREGAGREGRDLVRWRRKKSYIRELSSKGPTTKLLAACP